jgi:AcrR family transcriptional regulator
MRSPARVPALHRDRCPPRYTGCPRRRRDSVAEKGLAGATVEPIAHAADIGRATYFRYFSSKEDAVAEGMTTHWLDLIMAANARQPAHLSASEAVVSAFADLGDGLGAISGQVRELALLTRSSPVLGAWTLQIYVRYEEAIAALVAPRVGDLGPEDPRPRLLGACDGINTDRAR